MPNRVFLSCCFFCLCLFVLASRLFAMQVCYFEFYSRLSGLNYTRYIGIDAARGRILSADGAVLAYNVKSYIVSSKGNLFDSSGRSSIKNETSWQDLVELFSSNGIDVGSGCVIDTKYSRLYPMSDIFTHVVGYYSTNNCTGLEQVYNDILTGVSGVREFIIDAKNVIHASYVKTNSVPGEDLFTTIDSRIQVMAYELLASHKAAACIMMNINTGDIKCLVSIPSYNNNLLTSRRMDSSIWDGLSSDALFPMLNRVVSGQYQPGSILKLIIAVAALEYGISPKRKIFCTGQYKVGNHTLHCWKKSGHGAVDIKEAIYQSCDVYFYTIAQEIPLSVIIKYLRMFGFGEKTGIDLPTEAKGMLPPDSLNLAQKMMLFMGQGRITVTPIQLIVAIAQICNMGNIIKPNIVVKTTKSILTQMNISHKTIQLVQDSMYAVCNNIKGTAYRVCNGINMIGKSSTVQVKKINRDNMQQEVSWHHKDHAFFIGCIGPYICLVIIEHGEYPSWFAAPIVKKLLLQANALKI